MENKTIILPYTPEPVKRFLEHKKEVMEKLSRGENIDPKTEYADSEIPERLRNKYKQKD